MYKCYIDQNIQLSNKLEEHLLNNNISFDYTDVNAINSPEEVVYLLLHSKLPSETLNKFSNCKYIGIRAKNTDYIDKHIAKKQNIIVEGLLHQHGTDSVAEHTFSLILALSKQLITSNNNTKNNLWRTKLSLNLELKDKIIAVIGTGKIGNRVAEIAKAFSMKVLDVGKTGNLKDQQVNLKQALVISDIVSIHTSASPNNSPLIGSKELQLMKDDSILINTARANTLDYNALFTELSKGRFRGVGLDVFPEEPLTNTEILKFDNVIATPHLAYFTSDCLEKMNTELIEKLIKNIKNY